jgi:hypothetical protein
VSARGAGRRRSGALGLGLALAVCAAPLHVGGATAAVNGSARPPPAIAAPAADRRGEEQTFLTLPEWFLVFSPAEYATFVRTHAPDEFPFWGHIGQLWGAYGRVIRETRARGEPTNWGYHLMIVVIATSTTVEYAIRSGYETVIGRLSGATAGVRVPEEDYAARVAQEYVDFIPYHPWYEFDFLSRLRGLWTHTSLTGPNMLRKWERKYALTTEYAVKAVYGWLIAKASGAVYGTWLESTSVVVDRWPACAQIPAGVTVVAAVPRAGALLALPREQAFMNPAVALAACGVTFEEIAGNRSVILVSALGAIASAAPAGTQLMLRQPIITEPGRERLVLIVPVPELAELLRGLASHGLTLEHIFDY